jgi:omega-6 fatty acid desaturase (delta-12 desaturase)
LSSPATASPIAPSRPSGSGRGANSSSRLEGLDDLARPDVAKALVAIATSLVPFLALWVLMYLALGVSYWLVLALAIPTAGFLVRTYILFHDCAHGSLLPGRRANGWFGAVLGVIVFTPFARWRYEHIVHHATAGDLDRRFIGDVPTYTVAEYRAWRWPGHLGYHLYRNPLVMFGLGPLYAMVLEPRFPRPSFAPRIKRNVWATNAALVLAIGALCWLIGWQSFLLVETPLVFLAGGTGIWLFYVQHQFETTYWKHTGEWSYEDAALRGSSYLHLPKVLQFFSGNIGLHHVHHLNAKIPNYNLQRAHDSEPTFQAVPRVSLLDGLRTARLKLWDEDAQQLVTWRQLRRAAKGATQSV